MWSILKKIFNKPKYKPTGKIGYYTRNDYPWRYTVIFEKICEIGVKSKVRILEVSINSDCDRTKTQCLKNLDVSDWVNTSAVTWETDDQFIIRTSTNDFTDDFTDVEPLQNDDVDYTPHRTNPFRHNFIEQQ